MDSYLFNHLLIKEWHAFSKETVNSMVSTFQSIEHIKWERVYRNRKEFFLTKDETIPFENCNCPWKNKYLEWQNDLKQRNVECITPKHYSFPKALKHVQPECGLLYARGNKQTLSEPYKVAIVGTRKPTAYGRKIALELSRYLAEQGIVIVSGMAMGVDAIAHTGALDVGGKTIGVLASGVDYVYPKTNAYLYNRMKTEGGLFIAEKGDTSAPKPYQFPLRNRLISGLADLVIVVEASEKSGTLITAYHALEQGKTIFAVPGSIFVDQSKGTNLLISEGAIPLLSYQQILAHLNITQGPFTAKRKKNPPADLSPIALEIYNRIDPVNGAALDVLLLEMKFEYSEIVAALSELLLEDLCERVGINDIVVK